MCSWWFRSQSNEIDKAYVRVEILGLDFQKTWGNQCIKSRKVATFKDCDIFPDVYFSYVVDYKTTFRGGNKALGMKKTIL